MFQWDDREVTKADKSAVGVINRPLQSDEGGKWARKGGWMMGKVMIVPYKFLIFGQG